jgi:dipeptidase E
VRLFLASADVSLPSRGPDLAAALAELVDAGARTAVVLNALDEVVPDPEREARLEHECSALASLGTDAVELDLRHFYDAPAGLSRALGRAGLVWAAGGNAVALYAAMVRSGLDELLADRLATDELVYGGYSAGAVVAGPALRSADLFGGGDPGEAPMWGGLGLVDFSIVPHYRSGGADDAALEQITAHLQRRGLAHRVLRDGQAIVIAGGSVSLCE